MELDRLRDLIGRSKEKDPEAFAALLSEYQLPVFRLAFRLLCDEDDAKDIVQETFIKVWLSLGSYNDQYRFSTWLNKIAVNLCYDRLKSASYSTMKGKGEEHLPALASAENLEADLINKELKALIVLLTEELSPKQRLVFTLRDLEGMDTDEIATITRFSAAKIKSNLFLARKYIRERIKRINKE